MEMLIAGMEKWNDDGQDCCCLSVRRVHSSLLKTASLLLVVLHLINLKCRLFLVSY